MIDYMVIVCVVCVVVHVCVHVRVLKRMSDGSKVCVGFFFFFKQKTAYEI